MSLAYTYHALVIIQYYEAKNLLLGVYGLSRFILQLCAGRSRCELSMHVFAFKKRRKLVLTQSSFKNLNNYML